jgi:tetratricopeptide (TPR) repeat protein
VACNVASAADKLSFGPRPDWVILSKAPPPNDVSASAGHVQFLLADRQFHFTREADSYYAENSIRIRSPEGLSALGTLSLMWDPQTTEVTVHELRIVRGESVVDVLSSQSFTILRREKNLEYAALDGTLTATIQPSGLQVGDIVTFAFSMKRFDPVLAGMSEGLISGFPNLPMDRLRLRATWAKAANIQWKASDNLSASLEEHRERDEIELAGDIKDVQPLVQPEGAPLRFAQLREVQFSSFRGWKDISRLLAPHYDRAATLESGSALQKEIEKIRVASQDPVARVEAALALTEDQIRYVFLGMNSGGLIPAQADVTWTRRFGDCKAKTAFLLALLRGLGIDAQPVAVSMARGDGLNEKVPMVEWFDHVLVRASIGKRMIWLDGTRLGDRHLSNLPEPMFRWGLPLLSQGGDLIGVEARPLEQPSSDVKIRIDASKGAHVPAQFHVEAISHGDAGIGLNRAWTSLTAADLDRSLRETWKKQYNFIDIASVAVTFDESTATARSTMDGVAHMDWASDFYETDGLGLGYAATFQRSPGPHSDAPYAVSFPTYSRVTETIVLPHGGAGFSVEGEDISRTVGGTEYRRHAVIEKGVFTAEASVRALMPEFPAVEAKSVEQALREMSKQTLYIKKLPSYRETAADREQLTSKTPSTAAEFVTRGNQYLDDGSYDLATAEYTKALALDPKDDIALADRGLSEAQHGKMDEGGKDLDAAYALNPKNPVVFRGRAVLARKRGKMQDAIEALTTSLVLEPDNVFAYWQRAEIYEGLGNDDKALEDSAQVIRLQPDNYRMYWFRAGLLVHRKQYDQVATLAESELSVNSEDANAYASAAGLFERANRHDRAMASVNRAIELQPTEWMYLLRERIRESADLAGRRGDVEAALKEKPDSREARARLAHVQYLARQYQEEIGTLDDLLKNAKDSEYQLLRIVAQLKNTQSEAARRDLAEALARATRAREYNDICWQLAVANEELNTALEYCDKAIENSAGKVRYSDSRGFVLLRMSRYEDAAAEYTRALEMVPTFASSLYGRGIARLRLGEIDSGKADITSAHDLDWEVDRKFADYGLRQ